MFSREQDILNTLRLIEGLKLSLLDNVSSVYHAMGENGNAAVRIALARVLLNVYVLAARLGIDFSPLEAELLAQAEREALPDSAVIEKRFGDFSRLVKYLNGKGRKVGEK